MTKGPPKLFKAIFHLFCPKERRNEIEGDLNELYQLDLDHKGPKRANLNYLLSSLSMINFQGYFQFIRFSNFTRMLKLIIAYSLRSILRLRVNVLMGIFTLALGATASGFLLYYIHYESNYDNFHPQSSNIYRLNTISQNDRGEQSKLALAPVPSGPKLASEFVEVLDYTRAQKLSATVTSNNFQFEEDRFFFTDNSFFDFFPYKIIQGNIHTPLVDPQSIVLSESMAKKYFGEQDPLGQTITINTKKTFTLNFTEMSFTVKAIVEDPPPNTHLKYDFLASFSTLGNFKNDDWFGGVATYLKLVETPDFKLFDQKLKLFIGENLGPYLEARFNMSFEDFLASGRDKSLVLQPLTGIHLSNEYSSTFEPGVNKSFLNILLAVSLLILILTTINFFNLSIASGLNRLKEIGVRKSLGAQKYQMFFQFLTESLILGILALLISLIFTFIALGLLSWQQFELPDKFYLSFKFIGILGLATILTCLVSGVFISLSLSKISVIIGLRGSLLKGFRGIRLQKSLLGLQFFIAFITLMVATTFNAQNKYLINSDLGYDKEGLIIIKNIDKITKSDRNAFGENAASLAQVKSKAFSSNIPNSGTDALEFIPVNSTNPDNQKVFFTFCIEDEFLETYDLKILASNAPGANFVKDSTVLINENALKELGYFNPSEVLGQQLEFYSKKLTISGVISDFHYENLYTEVKPLVLLSPSALPEPPLNEYKYLSVKTMVSETTAHLALKEEWEKVNPEVPFNYVYLADHLSQSYKEDRQLGQLVYLANYIAIAIALLGLLSMSQVIFNVKLKEITIRKVLGASLHALYQHFMRQFLFPLITAFIVAIPLAYWFTGLWLNKFAYRITLGWELFVGSGLVLLILAIAVLTFNASRAAFSNPVDNLRSE